MKKFYREYKFILGFFVFLSFVVIFTNIDSEVVPKRQIKSLKNAESEALNIKIKHLRSPASTPEKEVATLILNKEFFCNSQNLPNVENLNQHIVLISFKICRDIQNVKNIEIINETNGFNAQIFKIENNSYKTDYIQLSRGMNKLKILMVLKDGQIDSESLEIVSGS